METAEGVSVISQTPLTYYVRPKMHKTPVPMLDPVLFASRARYADTNQSLTPPDLQIPQLPRQQTLLLGADINTAIPSSKDKRFFSSIFSLPCDIVERTSVVSIHVHVATALWPALHSREMFMLRSERQVLEGSSTVNRA